MSVLVDAIQAEIDGRMQHHADLQAQLLTVDDQLAQLRTMHEQAQNLNGGGPGIAPPPVEPKHPAKANGDQGSSAPAPGRKGGNAPDGRRRQSARRRSGSAPSRPPRTGASTTQREGGGTKRAAVLAYVQQHDRVAVSQVAEAVGLSVPATKYHLKTLRENGQVQAEGATSARVYFTTENGDQAAATAGHAKTTGTKTPLPQLKQRVTDAIARDPGHLNEERLAHALDVDREDIAIATGELLDTGDLALQPDGTYTIDRGGVSGSVDLRTMIITTLQRLGGASTNELAYQVNKTGGINANDAQVEAALLELVAEGRATRSAGTGGSSTWRAAE